MTDNVASTSPPSTPAGWYPSEGRLRWWDGTRWTDHYAPEPGTGGALGRDPEGSIQTTGTSAGAVPSASPNEKHPEAGLLAVARKKVAGIPLWGVVGLVIAVLAFAAGAIVMGTTKSESYHRGFDWAGTTLDVWESGGIRPDAPEDSECGPAVDLAIGVKNDRADFIEGCAARFQSERDYFRQSREILGGQASGDSDLDLRQMGSEVCGMLKDGKSADDINQADSPSQRDTNRRYIELTIKHYCPDLG